jgi:tetratricopeptide (TPR) repeat protein
LGRAKLRVGFTQAWVDVLASHGRTAPLATLLGLVKSKLASLPVDATVWDTGAGAAEPVVAAPPETWSSLSADVYLLPGAGAPFPAEVPPSELFTGRSAEVERLLGAPGRVWALCGGAGVGKSAVAREVCRQARWRGAFPVGVFWLNADTAVTLDAGLRSLACNYMGMMSEFGHAACSPEEVRVAVHAWLAAHPGWLLVLDNADDVEVVRPHVLVGEASDKGVMLITSRCSGEALVSAHVIASGTFVETLGVLCEDDAALLLEASRLQTPVLQLDHLSTDARDVALWLAGPHALAGLPLALTQAGAMIAAQGWSHARYAEEFKGLQIALFPDLSECVVDPWGEVEAWLGTLGLLTEAGPVLAAAGYNSLDRVRRLRRPHVDALPLSAFARNELADAVASGVPPSLDTPKTREVAGFLSRLGFGTESRLAVLTQCSVRRLDDLRGNAAVRAAIVACVGLDVADKGTLVTAMDAVGGVPLERDTARDSVRTTWSVSERLLLEDSTGVGRAAVQVLQLCAVMAPDNIPVEALVRCAMLLGPAAPLRVHVEGVASGTSRLQMSALPSPNVALEVPARPSGAWSRALGGMRDPLVRLCHYLSRRRAEVAPESAWDELPDGLQRLHLCDSVISMLSRLSLLSRGTVAGIECVSIHRLLQGSVLDRCSWASLANSVRAVCDAVAAGASAAWEQRIDAWNAAVCTAEVWCEQGCVVADGAAARRVCEGNKGTDVRAVELSRCGVLASVGHVLHYLGNEIAAESSLKEALAMRRRLWAGRDHSDFDASLHNLALVLGALDRRDDALPLFEESLAMRRRLWDGRDHPDVSASLINLASAYEDLGRLDDALPLFEEALAMARRLWGRRNHRAVSAGLSNLAGVYQALGRLDDALLLYEEALAMRRRLWGHGDNSDVSAGLSNMASVLQALGRPDDALPLFEEALAMARRLWGGRNHRDVSAGLANLASVLQALGRLDDALPLFEEALAMARRLWGRRNHRDVSAGLSNMASVVQALGRLDDALPLFEESLAMARRLWGGRDHSDVSAGLSNKASVLQALGRLDAALPLLEEALAMRRRLWGSRDHSSVSAGLSSLASVVQALGRLDDALPLFEEALAMRRRLWGGRDHSDVSAGLSGLASVLQALGRLDDALPLFEESLAMRRRLWGDRDHSDVSVGLNGLASVYRKLGRLNDALQLFEESLAFYRRHPGLMDRPNIALAVRGAADCHGDAGRFDAALELYGNAAEMFRLLLPSDPLNRIRLADTLRKLAALHCRRGCPGDALAPAQDAVAIVRALGLSLEAEGALSRKCEKRLAQVQGELGLVTAPAPP